jgi:hypothetical protein
MATPTRHFFILLRRLSTPIYFNTPLASAAAISASASFLQQKLLRDGIGCGFSDSQGFFQSAVASAAERKSTDLIQLLRHALGFRHDPPLRLLGLPGLEQQRRVDVRGQALLRVGQGP